MEQQSIGNWFHKQHVLISQLHPVATLRFQSFTQAMPHNTKQLDKEKLEKQKEKKNSVS